MKYPAMLFPALLTLTVASAAPVADDAFPCYPATNANDSRTTAKSKTEKSAPPAAPQPSPAPAAPEPRRETPAPPPHLLM